jgi:acyl-CoA thioester hydrolase
MNHFHVRLALRLDWSEMDMFGHINNVSYFKFIQASRVNYWETMGLTRLHSEMSIGPMLASTSCKFLKPLFYPGNIVVEAQVNFMKNTSFGIHHRILNAEGEIYAEAEDVIVMFDFNKNEKRAIPGEIRNIVEELEGRKY